MKSMVLMDFQKCCMIARNEPRIGITFSYVPVLAIYDDFCVRNLFVNAKKSATACLLYLQNRWK